MKNISIIGSGSFGCALANHLAMKGNNVKIWSFKQEEADIINNEHRCMFLKNSKLDKSIKCYTSYEESIENSEYIILVTPSSVIRQTCNNIKKYVTNQKIVLASKGLENGTNKLLSEVINEEIPNNLVGVLSGPSHAEELIKNMPTTVSFGSSSSEFNKEIKDLFENNNFSIELSEDIIGMQVGAALKNIIALASGMIIGLGYSNNILSVLMTKGLKEISNIGITLGAKQETFYGLSGLGDLIVTCNSDNSRNTNAGILFSKGKKIDEIKDQIGMVIESLDSLISAKSIMENNNLNCPIINTIYDIVYKEEKIDNLIKIIMN